MNDDLERAIRLRHLEQLRKLPSHALGTPPPQKKIPTKQLHVSQSWLTQITDQCAPEVAAAIAAGVRGSKDTVDWNVTIFTFLESCAVYLRDVNILAQAASAIKQGNHDSALDLLRSSDAPIQAAAKTWGLDYMTVCDLVDDHAEENWWWDGPYCGLFISRDAQRPFIGLAFKGTFTTSVAELLVDLAYHPVESTSQVIPNVHISTGVYKTLLQPFSSLDGQTPFSYIVAQLDALLNTDKTTPYDLHLTGHSLGASYATLFHAGLLSMSSSLSSSLPSSLVVRDLYTFGSPRLGLTDFAQLYSTLLATHGGTSWRIIDAHDPVTLVPPEPLHIGSEGWVFCHVDKAVKIQKDGSYAYVESEVQRGPDTLGVGGALLHFSDHFVTSYWTSLLATAKREGLAKE